jgi:hypothetical protein
MVAVLGLSVSTLAQVPGPTAHPPGQAPSAEAALPEAAPATSGAPTDGTAAAPGYDIRLRQLRERVEDLKGRVFDSKTKLMLLREQILQNLIVEARASIVHVNDTSSALILEEVLYFLDNEKIYYQSNRDGALESKKEFSVYSGSVSPGNHLLNVEMVYRGNGKVFTYLSGYVFRVKSSFPFFATKGREVRIKSVAYERGGAAARLEDRPSIRFEMQQQKVVEGAAGAVPGAAPGSGTTDSGK